MSLTKVSYSMINGAFANVLDFGAVADYVDGVGGTDNTKAFQTAIDSGAAVVYIPQGSYYCLSSLKLPVNGITILGEGRTKSLLYTIEHPFKTVGDTQEVRLKSFGMWGPAYTGTSQYAIYATHDIINTLIEDVLVQRGHGLLLASGAGTTDIVKFDVRDCYLNGSSNYAIHIGPTVSMNSLSFENTWFDGHQLGAILSEGSLATGYSRFESCIFESNYGQHAVSLTNAQVTFNNCLFYNNGRHASGGSAIVDGSDVLLTQGNQQITKFQGCVFNTPFSDVVNWTTIVATATEANMVAIENCYADGGSVAAKFITTNTPNPASLSIRASRWVNYTDIDAIVGRGIDATNNISQNGQSNVNNLTSSVSTTDATPTKLWGGTYWGPWFSYPTAPAIIIYEARVSGGDTTCATYYTNIVRSTFKVTQSGGNYTFTNLGSASETAVTSGGTINCDFSITNNGTSAAGIDLLVTGVAATTINWTASVSMTANKIL